jgi:hypothetical protein
MPISRTRSLRRPIRAITASPSTTRVTLPLNVNHSAAEPSLFADGTSRVAAVAARYPAAASTASNESFHRMLTPVVAHDGSFSPGSRPERIERNPLTLEWALPARHFGLTMRE